MNTKMTIVALVADETTITLYTDDGEQHILNSNEYRTKEIVDKIMPLIASHRKAKIDISSYIVYGKFEQKTKGFVRFFRIAKDAVSSVFGRDPDSKDETPLVVMTAAEIEKQGSKNIPMTLSETDTVVAIIGEGEDARAIPQMENLAIQFENSIKGSEVGMLKFLSRISKVINQRGHSVQDLLKFLEKADLPIANDGSVIAYKILKKINLDHFVDCHTGKVKQKVGSHVFMDPSKVDSSRTRDCSHGLHIARRDYISSFNGDVVVLCKINPEDFIAVPQYSPSKVRVSGYHIIFELPKEAKDLLRKNNSMTSDGASSKMLACAISGQHIPVIETVEIKGEKGYDVLITPVTGLVPYAIPQQTHKGAQSLNVDTNIASPPIPSLTPKELREQADKAREQNQKDDAAKKVKAEIVDAVVESKKPKTAKPIKKPAKPAKQVSLLSKADETKILFSQWAKTGWPSDFEALQDVKKKAKKSYAALGLQNHQVLAIKKHLKTLK